MLDEAHLVDRLPVADRDLLSRLSRYFDNLENRLREGEGWFIFNAKRDRSARLVRYIIGQLAGFRPLISSYHLAWRDFALHAYVMEVEMAGWIQTAAAPSMDQHIEQEHRIANQVAQGTNYHLMSTDVLVLSGIVPTQPHEVTYLDKVVATRYSRRFPSILITPLLPHELEERFRVSPGGGEIWQRFFDRMYQTSLMAL